MLRPLREESRHLRHVQAEEVNVRRVKGLPVLIEGENPLRANNLTSLVHRQPEQQSQKNQCADLL
jgi:hypothetical protein